MQPHEPSLRLQQGFRASFAGVSLRQSVCETDPSRIREKGAHMPAIVIVGAQWGDEGKGKATDLLGSRVDYVVKFNGGNNAGHTVVIGDEKYALHLLPSGILTPGCVPVIGNGVVIDLGVLFEELDGLDARGIDTSRLLVSASAHVIPEYNRTLDKVTERFLGSSRLGTTGRGIGPTYADKMNRIGIRVQDIFDEKILRQKVDGALELKNQILAKIYNRRAVSVDEIVDELLTYRDRLAPMVADTGLALNRALGDGATVLLEAGQATLLDVDHGTYPFVTSSSATAGGACTGSGIPPTRIERVIAIVKAYTTRVGAGPFPTELFDDSGEFLRKTGAEYGTTTGRPRRCGWFDAVIARYAARVNGVTDFVLTKLDVLTGLEKVPVCVAYDVDGVRHDEMPVNQTDFHHAKPVYEELPGWSEDISGARTLRELPANASSYIAAVEEMSGARVSAIGVGPDRDETVVVHDLL
jgi:adenylosuccinate synthase